MLGVSRPFFYQTDTGTEEKLNWKGGEKKKSKQDGCPGVSAFLACVLSWFYVVAQCLLTVERGFVHA